MNSELNLWMKRFLSLFGCLYCVAVILLDYGLLFYELEIPSPLLLCIGVSALSVIVLVCMLYTRCQFLTRIVSIVLMPVCLPVVLLAYGEWELIVPIVATALIIFFLGGAGERVKTIFGVVYLVLYVLASLGFFMVLSFFSTGTSSQILSKAASNSSMYRYTLTQTEDSSGGSVSVEVEPNDRDLNFTLFALRCKGYARDVYVVRPIPEGEMKLEWTAESRQDVTAELLELSDQVTLHLSASQLREIGRDEDAEALENEDEETAADDGVLLSSLTDEDLEILGVPETIDVLKYNDKVVFRSYTAILEDYFAVDNRSISLIG